ncbi:hypothetical protein [Phyllobacterium myrsinacearum]|uniref:Uncharacterized protein n=1 Tax=Phyllobacterium myrsinacearum TaxID=28101 RepID=A0A839EMF7_9HYPH|nr:hypothetical protein [Phyllobacterium myrsinacearum]MBA8881251.1 hypothetical protein [Phyllobacterium myrsinacearum]
MYSIDPEPYQTNAWRYIGVVLFLAALAFGLGRYNAVMRAAAETDTHRLSAEHQGKVILPATN